MNEKGREREQAEKVTACRSVASVACSRSEDSARFPPVLLLDPAYSSDLRLLTSARDGADRVQRLWTPPIASPLRRCGIGEDKEIRCVTQQRKTVP